jgi:SAM-dependent methyltransferase
MADGPDLEAAEAMSYVEGNRAHWTGRRELQEQTAHRAWAQTEPSWGLWNIPETELRALPDVAGLDVLEAGCGVAYWSAWLARLGARPVGLDLTPSQLEIARRMQAEFGLEFPLVEGNAEELPFADESFDLVFSEYGASIWCDPHRWIPEAARVLRPGGRLVFLKNSVIGMLCAPDDEDAPLGPELVRDYFGVHRFDWSDGTAEFHLNFGDTIRLLRTNGLELETLIEPQAPADASTHPVYDFVTADWARQWPSEEIWRARKPSA